MGIIPQLFPRKMREDAAYQFMLQRILNIVKDTILPVNCPGCGKPEDGICKSCLDLLRTPLSLLCPHCPKPSLKGQPCGRHKKSALLRLVFASFYNEKTVARAVGLVKYHGSSVFLPSLAAIFSRAIIKFKTLLPDSGLVIAVPPLPHKKRENGRDLPGLLAKTAAQVLNLELADVVIARKVTLWTILGVTQSAKLEHNDPIRFWSAARAFQVKNAAKIRGRNVLLVDDVSTTGSTLHSAASALKSAGASSVTALTLARG